MFNEVGTELKISSPLMQVTQLETIYEDECSIPESQLEPESDDPDFEFDGVRTKKGKSEKSRSAKPVRLKAL